MLGKDHLQNMNTEKETDLEKPRPSLLKMFSSAHVTFMYRRESPDSVH